MHVVIIGAGQVGESIAADLQHDHDVVIVENDAERADELTYSLDVLTITADGSEVETLEEAGVDNADMVLATTDDDETNIVACSTAKALCNSAFTIARIKHTKYLRTWKREAGAFGIDLMVCTNLLTAESIVRVVGLPAARDSDVFADGRVQMAEFEIDEESPIVDQTVEEADRFDSLTFAAILRDGDVEVPRGDACIQADDRVVVIGSPRSVQTFARTIAPEESPEESAEVVVIGGSEVGYHVCRLLEERGLSPRLVERDHDRARTLAEELPRTVVMESDATDMGFLEREHVGDADILVSTLDSDEKNLLECLLARRLGVKRTVAVVDRTSYVDLFETVGVDVGVSPREVVAEEITRFTQSGSAENIAFIESDKAEVIEVEIDEASALAGKAIRDAVVDLPDGVVIGAITRNGEFVVPRGDTEIHTGDHVVAFIETSVLEETTEKL
ncbi:Trk system potassium transporter TrkA [Halopenitus sp. H-Gu1]|uniref:Trk system potassium transporter TrkA n=1 Tax=Halopenitus sp. H-Gu1 TaxID=3242697 RepID=UPI00359CC01C